MVFELFGIKKTFDINDIDDICKIIINSDISNINNENTEDLPPPYIN